MAIEDYVTSGIDLHSATFDTLIPKECIKYNIK